MNSRRDTLEQLRVLDQRLEGMQREIGFAQLSQSAITVPVPPPPPQKTRCKFCKSSISHWGCRNTTCLGLTDEQWAFKQAYEWWALDTTDTLADMPELERRVWQALTNPPRRHRTRTPGRSESGLPVPTDGMQLERTWG